MAANGISTLPTKRERQIAKLELAKTNRAASGRRSEYILDQLPTVYAEGDNDTNNVVDNLNEGGLVVGRPWVDTVPEPEPEFEDSYAFILTANDASLFTSPLKYSIIFTLGSDTDII